MSVENYSAICWVIFNWFVSGLLSYAISKWNLYRDDIVTLEFSIKLVPVKFGALSGNCRMVSVASHNLGVVSCLPFQM